MPLAGRAALDRLEWSLCALAADGAGAEGPNSDRADAAARGASGAAAGHDAHRGCALDRSHDERMARHADRQTSGPAGVPDRYVPARVSAALDAVLIYRRAVAGPPRAR